MDRLKLIALDEQDLEIVSAHAQDAVLKVGDMEFIAAQNRFVLAVRRFVWERKQKRFSRVNERRYSALHFDRVLSVKTAGVDLGKKDEVLSLLAIRFIRGDAPAGAIELDFSGSATLRLDVECIEARLADLGPAWETPSRPVHRD